MIIIFIGSTLSGKTEQTTLLGKKLNLPVFSMGKLIRDAREKGDPKAVKGFEEYTLRGLHLPNSLKLHLLKEKLDPLNEFVLDNYPATQEDLDFLLEYIKNRNLKVDKVFFISISEDEMIRRAKSRGRIDDDINLALKKKKINDEDRKPVLKHFKEINILEEIDGNKDIETIYKEVLGKLNI